MKGGKRSPVLRPARTARTTKKDVPDSSASVAGYEYQFLWAALRCLSLLIPNTKLAQVVVESLYGPDIETLQAKDEDLLVVDVSEYEGGNTIDRAERVIVSQLKYSPTAPKKAWTINGLCASRSDNPKRSIIGGLGLIFQRFWNASNNRSQLPQHLFLRLVTNRPLQKAARSTITKVQQLITERTSPALPTTAWLLRQPSLSQSDKKHLAKLIQTSGLKSTQFTIFLSCLDITGYGQPALDWLETLARKTLVEMGGSWREDTLQQLLARVRKEAIEGRRTAIRAADVLAYFFCSDREFLPAPNRIKPPAVVIDTADIHGIAATVKGAARQVLAHGAAGKGKSVTVSNIVKHLPPGSHLFLYDCFANGEWEGSSHGYRHSSVRFCNQLVNELSVRFGTGLFYSPKHTAKQDRWTLTREALNRVSKQIPGEGLFIVVVDAADNARDSYEECSAFDRDDLFLAELWRVPLPAKVRLVVTCRTERRKDISAPSGIQEFELLGFQPQESAALLTQNLGPLSSEAQTRFHDATEGTPRLQDYWISNELRELTPKDRETNILLRDAYGIEAEYKSWVRSASSALPRKARAQNCIAMLRCLRQPFSLADFAACAELSCDDARDFCLGLRSGLVLTENEDIEFRDQDFEAVLDSSISKQKMGDAHAGAASWCSKHVQSHPYAAKNVAYHLDKAGCHRRLIDQALNLGFTESLASPDESDSTATECVHLALRACRSQQDYSAPLQLSFSLAKLARSREAGEWLFLEYPETCILNGLYPSVRKAILGADDESGSIHFRIAYALALKGDLQTARTHIVEGDAWLRKHIAAQDDHGMAAHIFNVTNSAERGVAIALLDDFPSGARAATPWISKAKRVDALYEFSLLLATVAPELIDSKLPRALSDPVFHAAHLAGVFRSQIVPKGKRVRDCLDAVLNQSKQWGTSSGHLPAWVIGFAEVCLRCRADRKAVVSFLKKQSIQSGGLRPYFMPRSYWEQESHEYIRSLALLHTLQGEELSVSDLFPEKKDNSGYDYERNQVTSIASKLLPSYTLRAKAFRSNWNAQRAWDYAKKSLMEWRPSNQLYGERYQPFFRTYASNIVDTMVILAGSCSDFTDEIVERGEAVLYPTDFAGFCMDMAEKCARKSEYSGAAQDLAMHAVKAAVENPMKARERVALLMRASLLIGSADSDIAADLVSDALSAAQEVDEDAPQYAKALSRLAFIAGERHGAGVCAHAELLWKALLALELCAEDEDGIDWGLGVEGITALSVDLGYSAMLALDRKGTMPLPRAMAHYLKAATLCHQGRMSHHLAGVFSPLCESDPASVTILAKLMARLPENEFPRDLFDSLVRSVILNTRYEKRANMCRELLSLASSKGLQDEQTEMLEAQVDFYSHSNNWKRYSNSSESEFLLGRQEAVRKIETKLKKRKFAGHPVRALSAIIASGVRGDDLRQLIVEHGQLQRGGDVTRYLDALVALKGDAYYSHEITLAAALCDLLTAFPQRRLIERWIAREYGKYVIRSYPSLVVYDLDYDSTAKRLLELGCVPAEKRTEALLGILCEYGHRLSPRRLFELSGSFAHNSSTCSANSALLSELNVVQGKAEDLGASNLPTEPILLCSRIIHDVLGHEDNRIRWRALHAFRLAVMWGSQPFIDAAIDLLNRNDCRLWLSAKDWLLFALLHTSREHPSLLVSHTNSIWALATNDSFPHAGHQELARRILEHVIAAEPSALDIEKKASLSTLNRPLSCLLEREGASVGRKNSFRFRFDFMDTMPYWYSGLGHAFGLHRCDVAVRAEKWICDEWNLTNAKCREEEDRLFRSYNYELTSHRHGGLPTVETYTRYIEWHAMMMTAGEMVRRLPAKVEQYSDGYEDRWESWIGRNAFAADISVLSDLRGPVPLDPQLHGALFSENAVSLPLTVEDYRSAFSVSKEETCVAGNYSVKASGIRWHWDIDTALVSKKTARALGIAILSLWTPYAVRLPLFNIERVSNLGQSSLDILAAGQCRVDSETVVSSGSFQIKPWIVACYSGEEIAGNDPMWRDSGRNWLALDRDVIQALGLQASKLHNLYTDGNERRVAWCQVWHNEDVDSQDRDRDYTAGHRLVMLKSEIIRFLKQVNLDLIVRVTIHRDVERSYASDKTKYKGGAGVFILRNTGKLESVGIRAEDSI